MGALHESKCYPTNAQAVDAYYGSAPVSIQSGSTTYATRFEQVGGVWKSSGYSISSAGSWTLRYRTDAPSITFPVCDESANYKDGIALGWGIAAAMVMAAALMSLRQGAK